MDEAPGLTIFLLSLAVLAAIGIVFLLMDFRHFNIIQEQCQKQGYIQNETIRINCSLEKPQ